MAEKLIYEETPDGVLSVTQFLTTACEFPTKSAREWSIRGTTLLAVKSYAYGATKESHSSKIVVSLKAEDDGWQCESRTSLINATGT